MEVITIILFLFVSYLFTIVAKKLKISVVIGLIASGIFLGTLANEQILFSSNTDILLWLGNLGFLALMFLAGLEISWCLLYKERKEALIVAFFAALIPLMLGLSTFLVLGFSLAACITIGISMSVTAEATKAHELMELNKLDSEVGIVMMGAGIIDDVLALLLFAAVTYIFTGKAATHEFPKIVLAIGVFLLGIAVHKYVGRYKKFVEAAEKILLLCVIPFFFISIGIYFNFHSLFLHPWYLIIIFVIALAGKIIGSMIAKPFTRLTGKQLYLVGWAMNSRGAIELALALLAFEAGLIEQDIYSSLVIMALSTTLIFPFIIKRMLKKNPEIMGESSKSCVLPRHLRKRV
jgi:Kef-type K+ transport system membrane component KefB